MQFKSVLSGERVGAIFDLDGTLVDSLPGIHAALNDALREEGKEELQLDQTRAGIGLGLSHLCRHALQISVGRGRSEHEETVRRLAKAFSAHYEARWREGTQLYPGMGELVDELRGKGVFLGVISNKPDLFTREMVSSFFPRGSFDSVRGKREGVPAKPNPAVAREVLGEHGLRARDVFYVGDSEVDLDFAQQAGLAPVIVGWGYNPPEEKDLILAGSVNSLREALFSK